MLAPLVQVMEHIFPADEAIHHTTSRSTFLLDRSASFSGITVTGSERGDHSPKKDDKVEKSTADPDAINHQRPHDVEQDPKGSNALNNHSTQTTNTLTQVASSLEAQTAHQDPSPSSAHDDVDQYFRRHSPTMKDTFIFLVLLVLYLGISLMILVSETNNVLFINIRSVGPSIPVFWSAMHIVLGVWQFLCMRIMLEDFAFTNRPGRGPLVRGKWAVVLRFVYLFLSVSWFLMAELFFFLIWLLLWLSPTGLYLVLVGIRLLFSAMRRGLHVFKR